MAKILCDVWQSDIDDEQIEIGETDADANNGEDLIGRRCADSTSETIQDRHVF